MLAKLKIIFATLPFLLLASCESIKDDYADCGVWLEFVFDHNMEYADSFDPQVDTVDVYIFDAAGKFVQARRAAIGELQGRKRMFLNGLSFGEYRVLTVGNLTEHFRFADRGGNPFVPGETTIDQAVSALKHSGAVSHEFPHFYFGPAVEVAYNADLSVYRVPLIRQTNRFSVVLQTQLTDVPQGTVQGPFTPRHTVEIVAPEAGAYDWLNNPTDPRGLVYRPWSLLSRLDFTEKGVLLETAAKINTMRLLENEWNGYRIIVRDIAGGNELYSNDLLSLLAASKPNKRPDGTELPRSEYFDREGDWLIVIVYKNGGNSQYPDPVDPDGAFVALRIMINGWIVWQTGMDV
ncbi:MAG: FimB/Mfa2 family fimbrial subunit [Rikenellaceae bacterium]|jgi:hypothetical protein|nr:FimB/Mfa2 family fimbrial subunit [Rikenellaceae bacterium]